MKIKALLNLLRKQAIHKAYMNQALAQLFRGEAGPGRGPGGMAHRSTNFVHNWRLSSAFSAGFCAMAA
ncbi:hypothetical protein [Hydrogenophaga crocea]|uniref:Uncharacterized protein n=1 Tax=Hydrogenophaga crocea TaxID=2716225 RepID=A0A6G8ILN0_9BURK|nr:hypothetical protein [Hydrogenophaga crocea]QIM54084.1 hypothetical protein G9Q37_18920 [Hydrogenophaga crocea]